jgi:putative peptidoglycan lipid II flippase
MATLAPTIGQTAETPEPLPVRLGGYAAMAESAWMGCVQATEVLDPLWTAPAAGRSQRIVPRLPRIQLAGLFTRELSIAEASFVLMASFFFSAALGAVRQVLFNAQFGVSMEANAYYAAFRLPDTLFSLIAGGALSSAMIPVLLSTRREDGESAGWRLVNLVTTTLLAAFALVVFLGVLFAPNFVVGLLAPGFDAETSELTITLTRIMLIQPVILAVGSVATAVLNSRNQFVPTALSIISHNVALISGILVARFFPGLGIYGPTLGVLGGAILQVIILLLGLREWSSHYQPLWNPRDGRLREIVRLLIPNGASVSVNYAGFIVDTAFATKAPEVAGLAAMYNAWLLVGLPIALLGQAVGQAAFPRLAAHADAGEWREMRRSLFRSLGAVVALAVPAMLGLLFLGRIVIRLLFEHGEFDAASGDLTFRVLTIFTYGLPAYVATEVISRGLIALRDTRTPLVTNTFQLIGRIVLIMVLLGRMGVLAIPTAFAVSATLETLLLGTVLLLKLGRRLL